jgi:hypothetical protein
MIEIAQKQRQEWLEKYEAAKTYVAWAEKAINGTDYASVRQAQKNLPKARKILMEMEMEKGALEIYWRDLEERAASEQFAERVRENNRRLEAEQQRVETMLETAAGLTTLTKAERTHALERLLDGDGKTRMDGSRFVVMTGVSGLSERVTLAADGATVSFSSE